MERHIALPGRASVQGVSDSATPARSCVDKTEDGAGSLCGGRNAGRADRARPDELSGADGRGEGGVARLHVDVSAEAYLLAFARAPPDTITDSAALPLPDPV